MLYLYAFSLRDQGQQRRGGRRRSSACCAEYPRSRFRADAWMAVAEYRFYEHQDFAARPARPTSGCCKYPRSPLYGLALFKTALCAWKLGHTEEAAARFKAVLDLGQKAKEASSAEEQKRAAELSDQALEYLVELFTEDDSKTAEDAYAFLAQIGGKAYSQRVMRRFADTVFDQTRYERAAQAYQFLISLDRKRPRRARCSRSGWSSRTWRWAGATGPTAEMRRLAMRLRPQERVGQGQRRPPQADRRGPAPRPRGFIRTQAKSLHARAQRNEKESRVVDKRSLCPGGRGLRLLPGAVRRQRRQGREPRCATCAATSSTSSWATTVPAGHEYLAVGQVASRSGPTTRTPC